MATTIPQENTAAIAANTEAISDLAAALAAEIENRRQIVDRAGAAAVEAVGGVLRSGFTPWEFSGYSEGVEISGIIYAEGRWRLELDYEGSHYSPDVEGDPDATELYFRGQYKEPEDTIRAVRHLITPTKTSQLTNDSGFLTQHQDISGKLDGAAAYPEWEDKKYAPRAVVSHNGRLWKNHEPDNDEEPSAESSGWTVVSLGDLKQDALSPTQLAAVNSGVTAAKVAAWDGYAAQIAAKANASDVATALALKANASDVATALALKANAADLPYALVTPGEWNGNSIYGKPEWYPPYGWVLEPTGSFYQPVRDGLNPDAMRLEFDIGEAELSVFTRASLPGHLCDRAVNAVPVSTDTTLTLPALVYAGKARDFLVRLAISGSTVPTITFAAPTGESIVYETDGDEFPVPDEAGTWIYSFTETAAHTFAVSLKKVNAVTQGGS